MVMHVRAAIAASMALAACGRSDFAATAAGPRGWTDASDGHDDAADTPSCWSAWSAGVPTLTTPVALAALADGAGWRYVGALTSIAAGSASDFEATRSLDGCELYFTSTRDGGAGLYVSSVQ